MKFVPMERRVFEAHFLSLKSCGRFQIRTFAQAGGFDGRRFPSLSEIFIRDQRA